MTKQRWHKSTGPGFFPAFFFMVSSALIVPLVYFRAVPDPALAPRLVALNVLNLIFSLILWFGIRKKTLRVDAGLFRRNIYLFFLAGVVVAAISVFFAINRSEAAFEWFKYLTFFIFFTLASVYLSNYDRHLPLLLQVVVIYGVVNSAKGIQEMAGVISMYGLNHQTSYLITAFSSNRNLYSELLFILLPFTVAGSVFLKRGWRVVSLSVSLLLLVLIVMLLGRSSWVAIAASLVFAMATLVLFRRRFLSGVSPSVLLRLGVIILVSVIAGIVLFSRWGDPGVFKKQIMWVHNYQYGSSLERVHLWEKSICLFRESPLTGVGQGNWRIAAPACGLEGMRSENGDILFQRPHNDFFWALSENGIFGLLFYLLFFISCFFYAFRIITRSPDNREKILSLILISGVTGYLVIANLSFPKERMEHQIFLMFIVAVIAIHYHRLAPAKRRLKGIRFGIPAALLLSAVALYIFSMRIYAELHITRAYQYRMKKDYVNVLKETDKAMNPFYTIDGFSTPPAWYKGEALFMLGRQAEAHSCYAEAYRHNPNHLHVLNNLGTTFELKGERSTAKNLYKRSLHISPNFTESLLNLCVVYYNEKQYDSAFQTIKRAGEQPVTERHRFILKTVLSRIAMEIPFTDDETLLKRSVERILRDEEWTHKVFLKTWLSGKSFQTELLDEVIYLLETVDGRISAEQAEQYRKKFFPE